jgi:hypothetical protein
VIRAVGYLLAEVFWTVVHRVLDPYATWDHEEDDRTTPRNVAGWIGDHRTPHERG